MNIILPFLIFILQYFSLFFFPNFTPAFIASVPRRQDIYVKWVETQQETLSILKKNFTCINYSIEK